MPKRSNEFQALITHIYRQLAPQGAKVTESAMLPERCGATEREIDILLEQEMAGHSVRIGIECRDRKAKADVTWIDDVIGKFKDLDVDKVVVVSRSGFTVSAVKKAAANKIDTCTFEQATARNWPSEFMKLGMGIVTRNDHIVSVALQIEPLPAVAIPADAKVERENGEIVGSLQQLTMEWFNAIACKDISNYLKEHFLTLFKVMGDFQKTLEGTVPVSFDEPFVIRVGDTKYRMTSVLYTTRSTFAVEVKPVVHYTYKNAGISICTIDGEKSASTIRVVQVPRAK